MVRTTLSNGPGRPGLVLFGTWLPWSVPGSLVDFTFLWGHLSVVSCGGQVTTHVEVPHFLVFRASQRLSEEVCPLSVRGEPLYVDNALANVIANEVHTNVDVFGSGLCFTVGIGQCDRTLIVLVYFGWDVQVELVVDET